MYNSKAHKIIFAIPEKDKSELCRFLKFCLKKNAKKELALLKAISALPAPGSLSRKDVSDYQNALKPSRNLINNLLKGVEAYIVFKENQRSSFNRIMCLSSFYERHGFENFYGSLKRSPVFHAIGAGCDQGYFQYKLMLKDLSPKWNSVSDGDDILARAYHHMDVWATIEKARIECELANRKRLRNEPIEDIPPSQTRNEYDVLSDLQLLVLRSRKASEPVSLSMMIDELEAAKDSIDNEHFYQISRTIVNECIRAVTLGDVSGAKNMYRVLKLNWEERIIEIRKELAPRSFQKTVMQAVYHDEIDWAKRFYKEARKYVKGEDRDTWILLSKIMIDLAEGLYTEARGKLASILGKDYYMKTLILILQMQEDYYSCDFDSLERHYRALRSAVINRAKSVAIDEHRTTQYGLAIRWLCDQRIKKEVEFRYEVPDPAWVDKPNIVHWPWLMKELSALQK